MRKWDIVIVRFFPIPIFIIMAVDLYSCWNGINSLAFNHLHCNSFFYAGAKFFISLSNPKYHCVWNRAMYVNLMVAPLIDYVDARWNVFYDAEPLLVVLSVIWMFSLLTTLILAIRHFVLIRKRKRIWIPKRNSRR